MDRVDFPIRVISVTITIIKQVVRCSRSSTCMVVTVVEGLCLPLLLADVIQHRKQGGAASEQVSQLSRAGGELVYKVVGEFFLVGMAGGFNISRQGRTWIYWNI